MSDYYYWTETNDNEHKEKKNKLHRNILFNNKQYKCVSVYHPIRYLKCKLPI